MRQSMIHRIREFAASGVLVIDNIGKDMAASDFSLKGITDVVLVATGLTYATALAAKAAYEDVCADCLNSVRVCTPQELLFYTPAETLPMGRKAGVFLLDIESRGEGMVQAAETARDRWDAVTVGISLSPDTAFANAVEHKVIVPAFVTDGLDETNNHYLGLVALHLLALRVACQNGLITYEEARQLALRMGRLIKSVASLAEDICSGAIKLAEKTKDTVNIETVASGMDYPTAWLVRSTVYREMGMLATVEDSEDWLHVNLLQCNPPQYTCLVVLSSHNPACDRCLRTMRFIAGLGRPTIAITDLPQSAFPEGVEVLNYPAEECDWMNPLVQFVPAMCYTEFLRDFKAQ